MADLNDFAARIGTLIKGRYAVGANEVLPDRGRLSPTTHPGGIDTVTVPGTYAVWTAVDAAGLGLIAYSGTLRVYVFGSVVEHQYAQHRATGIVTVARRRAGGVWSAWNSPAADDEDVAALITPGTTTYQRVQAAATGGTKIAAVSLSTGDSGGTETREQRSFRYPVRFGADVNRFRVHIQNVNPRYGSKIAGALSFYGLGFARDQHDINGPAYEGKLDPATWQMIQSGFSTPADGSEWVSPWVERPVKAGGRWLLSGGYTAAAGQQVYAMVGGGWVSGAANEADDITPATGMTLTRNMPLWVWLEVEVSADTPVVMYFGDSLASGVSARLPVFDGIANRHSWAHGHIASIYTASGTQMSAFTGPVTGFAWSRYASANPARPDGCVFEMGSNDIFGGATLAELKTRFGTCLDTITQNFTPRVVGMTILPRHDPDSPHEDTRQAYNEWLLTERAGDLVGVVDAAAPLTDPTNPRRLDPRWAASPTDIHLTAAGYARYIAPVPPLHS